MADAMPFKSKSFDLKQEFFHSKLKNVTLLKLFYDRKVPAFSLIFVL
jgi:hypothetical protein